MKIKKTHTLFAIISLMTSLAFADGVILAVSNQTGEPLPDTVMATMSVGRQEFSPIILSTHEHMSFNPVFGILVADTPWCLNQTMIVPGPDIRSRFIQQIPPCSEDLDQGIEVKLTIDFIGSDGSPKGVSLTGKTSKAQFRIIHKETQFNNYTVVLDVYRFNKDYALIKDLKYDDKLLFIVARVLPGPKSNK